MSHGSWMLAWLFHAAVYGVGRNNERSLVRTIRSFALVLVVCSGGPKGPTSSHDFSEKLIFLIAMQICQYGIKILAGLPKNGGKSRPKTD